MAMIVCPHCGEQVSEKAKKCVHCGEILILEEIKRHISYQIHDNLRLNELADKYMASKILR